MVSSSDLIAAPTSDNVYIHALTGEFVFKPGYQITYMLKGNPGDTGSLGGALWANQGAAQAFGLAAQAWAAVANIQITAAPGPYSAGNLSSYTWVEELGNLGNDLLGEHSLPDTGDLGGEFNNAISYFSAANNAVGGYSFLTFLHEIGHGLGLTHPHETGNAFPGVGDEYDTGDNQLNQVLYTVMSYNDGVEYTLSGHDAYGWSATPMAFDIAAIQHLYGANMSTATGDNVYVLPTVNAAGTYWACIWDAGGIDTISGAGATVGCTIDLRAATLLDGDGGGGWRSEAGQVPGGFTIANGVTIENATGSTVGDIIRGNDVANVLIGNGGVDTILGYGGNDRLEGRGSLDGGDGDDVLIGGIDGTYVGGLGNDRIEASGNLNGGAGDDVLIAGDSNAWVYGDVGNDQLTGGNFVQHLYGGAGDDIITAGVNGGGELFGDDGNDRLTGGSLGQTLHGGAGDDILIGGSGADIFYGDAGFDQFTGGAGDDTYYIDSVSELQAAVELPGGGNDTVIVPFSLYLTGNFENLFLSEGPDAFYAVGDALNNHIAGNESANLLLGGGGNDLIEGEGGNDNLFGEAGDDRLVGGYGIDYLVGGDGNDALLGSGGADAIYGGDGDDVLYADTDNFAPYDPYAGASVGNGSGPDFVTDILVGGAGNDILYGNSGRGDYDLLNGGDGNDSYYVDTGDDLTFEAVDGGIDTVYADVKGANNGVYLYANVENLVLQGTTTFGVGNELANTMTGNAAGNWLLGGAGNDVLNGKAGNDVLFGEGGSDTFVFEQGTGGDVIGDFLAGTDKIDLHAFGFADFQAVVNSMHEVNGTTAIDLGNGDFIVLNGVASAALHAGDFIL